VTVEAVRRWFSRLPELQRDLPILIVDGAAYTPRMILSEVERGTPLGSRLQALLEAGRMGTQPWEEEALLRLRVKSILQRMPPDKPLIATLGPQPRAYTAADLLREVEAGTDVGRRILSAEAEAVRLLLRLS